MLNRKKIKTFLPLVLLFILIIPSFIGLLRKGYFPMHDDMQAMRLLQMDKCVVDGQLPCRWVPDMGYGYGYPQFNYYSPLPYYFMETVHLVGLGFLDSVKAGFVASVIIAGIGMYLLGKALWGPWGGFLSALAYVYAPYRAVDMYVRGAVGEFWAIGFMPFIFWFALRIIKGEKKAVLGLALSLAALFTSHNISTLIFMPILFFWVVFLLKIFSKPSPLVFNSIIRKFIISIFWGFSISAFFLLPAWFERKFVHVETLTQGYFNYLAHFLNLPQTLFSSFWGYGTSEIGAYDDLSFSVGLFHWLVPLVVAILLFVLKKVKELKVVLFFLAISFLSLFMTHSRSVFIWDNFSLLSFLQFPWRFLTLATFTFSVAFGSIVLLFKKGKNKMTIPIFVFSILLIFFYSSFFRPREWLDITDDQKFSGESWERQLTISIFDYLPIYAKLPPASKAPDEPKVIEGSFKVLDGKKGTNWQMWELEVEKASVVELPLYYFPGWKVVVNNNEVPIDFGNELGLIRFKIDEGDSQIIAKLENTPIRSLGNLVSLIGLIIIPVYLKEKRNE